MVGFSFRMVGIVACLGSAAAVLDVRAQDIERGRQLYENHCQACHTVQVHGRQPRTVLSMDDLRDIVARWQRNQGLRWSQEDIEDVVRYLATTRYFFTSGPDR